MGEGTQAVLAPVIGWPIFCSSMSAMRSGAAHMPLPICALPDSPQASPIWTLRFSYAAIQSRRLDLALGHHRPGLHARMDFVAGAVEEAGVDERDPPADRLDARGEVGRGAALLVHHPDLDRVAREAEQILDRVEQSVGERGFVGAVHLGFDDVDRPGAAVAARALDVVQPDQAGDDRVEDALGRFAAIGQAGPRAWSSDARRCARTSARGRAG